jgi:hypothetical protein
MKLALTINNVLIPLPDDISLPLALRNPLFCFDGNFPGSFVFNTKIPASDQLRQAIGHLHRVNKHGQPTGEFDYVLTHGILRYEGKCEVIEADNDNYEVSFNIDNGDFYAAIKDKSLKDLDLGGDRDIADELSGAKLSSPIEIKESRTVYYEYDVPALVDRICFDLTSSLTQNGLIFTATQETTLSVNIKFNFVIDGTIFYGKLVLKKNGIEVSSTNIDTVNPVDITTDISVVVGDDITFQLILNSVLGEDIYYLVWCTLQSFMVEFVSDNKFDIAAGEDQDSSDFAVFPIQNTKFLDDFPDDAFMLDNTSLKVLYTEYFYTQNYWKDGRFPLILTGQAEGETYSAANLFTPFVYFKYLITRIAIEAGYQLLNTPFDYVTDEVHPRLEFKNACLFNAYAENTYTSDDPKLVPTKTTFNLSDHVPDMDCGEFWKQVCLFTGYMPVVNNQQKTITFIHLPDAFDDVDDFPGTTIVNPLVTVKANYKGIKFEIKEPNEDGYLPSRINPVTDKMVYKGEVADFASLPSSGNTVGDYYLVNSANMYYVWQYDPDTYTLHWCFYSRNFFLKVEEGDDEKLNIDIDLAPVIMLTRLDNTLGAHTLKYWKIPVTEQAGVLEGYPISSENTWGFQVLIYVGKRMDSNDELYPFGTSEVNSYDIADLVHNLSGTDIYAYHWQAWLEWIAYSSKPVKFYARLTQAQLRALNIHKPQRLADGSTIMIKELNVNLQADGLSVAEIQAYTV